MRAQSDMLQVNDYTHISHLDWQPSPPRVVVACAANDPLRSNDHKCRHSAAEGRCSFRRQRLTDKQRPYMSSSRSIHLYDATLLGEYEQLYLRIKSSPLSRIVWKQIKSNNSGDTKASIGGTHSRRINLDLDLWIVFRGTRSGRIILDPCFV